MRSAARPLRLLLLLALGPAGAPAGAWAQGLPPDSVAVERDAEAALDDLVTSRAAGQQLIEILASLAENPLGVNTATADELSLIPALTPLVAQRIVAFRTEHGPFGSLSELRAVKGVTERVLTQARPYLHLDEERAAASSGRFPSVPSLGEVARGLDVDLIQRYTRRLDLGRGYAAAVPRGTTAAGDTLYTTTYAGSPARLYTRLRARYERKLSLNLTLDKDPGEPFRWAPEAGSYGYDYASAHVALQDVGRVRTLIVGDYVAAFGQGVALWRSSAFGKGRDAVGPLVRSGRGLVPYGSGDENRFFRGVAGTVRLTPSLNASAFVSRRSLDATVLAPDTLARSRFVDARATTLTATGLHRTPSEMARKDALREALYGGALEYTGRRLRLGAVAYHARFDPALRPDTAATYRRFAFTGERATTVSLFGQYRWRGLLPFGEGARAPSGAVGGTGGLLVEVARRAEAVVVGRYFPRDFASPHGFALGERRGATQNEVGFYTGLRLEPAPRWSVTAYIDQYRFPWARFGVGRPSTGYDARLVAEHVPRPWLRYYLQLRTETRETGAAIEGAGARRLDGLREETRQSARLHGEHVFSDQLRLRARAEVARYRMAGAAADYGFLLYQDVRWRPLHWLQIDARLAFFDTDGYDARVYAYENDLLYAFAIPVLYGTGRRAYVLLHLDPLDRLSLQVKYGATRFRHVHTVGSGLDEVEGGRLREIRTQLRWRF